MSIYSVEQYISETEKLIRFGGSKNESALEQEFAKLLNEYCKQKGFVLSPKISIRTPSGKTIIPDGTINDSLRLDWGFYSNIEKTQEDPTIREKFNTYKFADYKESVIDLLKRVTTVSVKTVEIMREVEKAAIN